MVKSLRTAIVTLIIALTVLTLVAGCGGSGAGGGSIGPNSQSGTVSSSDGNAALTLQDNSGIPIKTVQITPVNNPPANAGLVAGTAYLFEPSVAIQGVGTVTIKYNPANVPAGFSQNNIALFELEGSGWTEVSGSTVDTTKDTVTGTVTFLTVYAAIATS